MDCRRVARELIEFFRFGELDARSAPHLEHLEVCLACRQEVGLDRELVHQMRRALAARVDGHAPSPGAWLEIRRRALEEEPPRWRLHLQPLSRLAVMGGTAIVLLALVAPAGLSPFDVQPELPYREPTWQNFEEAASGELVDPYAGRWWLRYATPAPSALASGSLATVDPWEHVVTPSRIRSGAFH
ncbi:MAG TPA: hypothetical protein VGA91_00180 [Candidatus Limnocylindria bacterium]